MTAGQYIALGVVVVALVAAVVLALLAKYWRNLPPIALIVGGLAAVGTIAVAIWLAVFGRKPPRKPDAPPPLSEAPTTQARQVIDREAARRTDEVVAATESDSAATELMRLGQSRMRRRERERPVENKDGDEPTIRMPRK